MRQNINVQLTPQLAGNQAAVHTGTGNRAIRHRDNIHTQLLQNGGFFHKLADIIVGRRVQLHGQHALAGIHLLLKAVKLGLISQFGGIFLNITGNAVAAVLQHGARRGNMLGCGAAAAAQNFGPQRGNLPHLFGKIFRVAAKKSAVVDNCGVAGVGHHRERFGGLLKAFYVLTQVIRAGNAVEAHRVNLRAGRSGGKHFAAGCALAGESVRLHRKRGYHKGIGAFFLDVSGQFRQNVGAAESFKQKILGAQPQKYINNCPVFGGQISTVMRRYRPNIGKDKRRPCGILRCLGGQSPAGGDNLLGKGQICLQQLRVGAKGVGFNGRCACADVRLMNGQHPVGVF